jgi:hypothetical protein
MWVHNIPTPEIARRTSHSEEACDRYIKGFKKVLKLHGDGMPTENIASELEMSKSLVKEYIEIIEDMAEMKKGEKG